MVVEAQNIIAVAVDWKKMIVVAIPLVEEGAVEDASLRSSLLKTIPTASYILMHQCPDTFYLLSTTPPKETIALSSSSLKKIWRSNGHSFSNGSSSVTFK